MKVRRQPTRLIPLLTLALLAGLPIAFPNRTTVGAADLARRQAIADAVASAPLITGGWVGRDFVLAPSAQRLLKPNAFLSREYLRIGERRGPSIHLLIVHCTDVRDMLGHYPPRCYPATGWSYVDAARPSRPTTLAVGGAERPARFYEFRRIEPDGLERRIRVLDMFILPDGTVTSEIDQIERVTERLALSAQGVAQLQVVTDADVPEGDALSAATEILNGMPDLLETLRLGPVPPDVPSDGKEPW